MKKSLFFAFAALTLVSLNAMADESRNYGKIVCTQNATFSPIRGKALAVVMNEIRTSRMYDMQVLVKDLTQPGSKHQVIIHDTAYVTTEDVQADFRASKSKTHIRIFLDELNQSHIQAPGINVALICRVQN